LAGRDAAPGILFGQAPARARVSRRAPGRERLLALRLELRGRAEARVRCAGALQFLRVRLIQVQPLRLAIRPMSAARVGPLIPVEAEPAKVLENRLLRFARGALGVGVLDAQDEGSALAARQQPVEERRARVADVEPARRAGCKSDSHDRMRSTNELSARGS